MDITGLDVSAYRIPTTKQPESDGTLQWNATTIVVVQVHAGGETGVGYTYCHRAAAVLIADKLAAVVCGEDALQVRARWQAMLRAVRNVGRPGVASCAISAVDIALWDLKAKLLEVPLASLLDVCHQRVPIYGSGGFCSYSVEELRNQLGGWVDQGIGRVKMKVGRQPKADAGRVAAVRDAIGADAELFVDANGAYTRKQALRMAERFAEYDVSWFEEPVSSDDLEGLRLLRDRGPAGMDIAAGEYGDSPWYFERMLAAGGVDVLQADVSRCLGITGILQAGAIAYAHQLDLSGHTVPTVHTAVLASLPNLRHLEYFWDHVRVENLLFDGVPQPDAGALVPNQSRPGLGIAIKHSDLPRYAI